jgi:hypothetical protein
MDDQVAYPCDRLRVSRIIRAMELGEYVLVLV